jgi:hypothetical protein
VRALKNALFKLEETRPHGRDYYVQNDASSQDASSEAMTEHLSRTYRLTQVLNELNYILDKIESQIDEKEKRKNE